MKVHEFIEKLREYPVNSEIVVAEADGTHTNDLMLYEANLKYLDTYSREYQTGDCVVI